MTASITTQNLNEHFAHCIYVLGGVTSASRRLGIDERAIRRFTNGERPITTGLLQDTAKALGLLLSEAYAAQNIITAAVGVKTEDTQA